MADGQKAAHEGDPFLGINAHLVEAARTGAPLGLILAVRGRIWPVPGRYRDRWRMRTRDGHRFTFRSEFVVAFDANGQALRALSASPRRARVS